MRIEKKFFKYDPAHLSNYGQIVANTLKQRLN